jgi:hypothetical protein
MPIYRINRGTKVALLLQHLALHYGSLDAVGAAAVMQCRTNAVASLCRTGDLRGYLRLAVQVGRMRIELPPGVRIEFVGRHLDVRVPGVEPETLFDEFDGTNLDPLLKVRRSCVPAAGLPMPQTNGVRSVFDLAEALA